MRARRWSLFLMAISFVAGCAAPAALPADSEWVVIKVGTFG